MRRLISIGVETIAASIFLLPAMYMEYKLVFRNNKQFICYLFFALYLSAVFAAVGIPSVNYIRFDATINVIPIIPIAQDLLNSLLNIILFIPVGMALPCLWERYSSFKQTIVSGFLLSLLIETLQIFTFRTSDVNDLFTNTAGTMLGYWIAKYLVKRHNFIVPSKDRNHFYIVSITSFLVMFFMQPFASIILWGLLL